MRLYNFRSRCSEIGAGAASRSSCSEAGAGAARWEGAARSEQLQGESRCSEVGAGDSKVGAGAAEPVHLYKQLEQVQRG